MGRKKRPYYRLVAIDSKTRRDGREIERLGWYNPSSVDVQFKINESRVVHWLDNGAIPSLTVKNLLGKEGFNHKYHLIRMGTSEEIIEKEMQEFLERQKNRELNKVEKRRIKKEEANKKAVAEEAPAEEAVAEEAPVEEAVAEEASAEDNEEEDGRAEGREGE